MSARAITRRSLLLATTGTLASGLTRPGTALGMFIARPLRTGAVEPILFERAIGSLSAGGAGVTVDLRRNADLLGARWDGAARARVEMRLRGGNGDWSPWASAATHGHAPEGSPRSTLTTGEPIWTGGGAVIQLRSDIPLANVRLSCVDASGGIGARLATGLAGETALGLASPVLAAGAGQPPIIARESWAQGMAHPRVGPAYGAVRMAFVHHTENPNGYSSEEVPAMLRAIFAFHRYVHGWNDIGYNFVVDSYGRIFEARAGGIDEPVVGAHAGGYNLVSTGVAVLGEFTSSPISAAASHALQRLLAWKLSLHGIPTLGRVSVRVNPAGAVYSRFPAGAHVALPRIAGHRDGDSTDCPGNVLYGELPALRVRIQTLAGRPARASLALGAPPSAGGSASKGSQEAASSQGASGSEAQRTLTGTLTFLDGTPIAGAPILIQARSVSRKGEVVRERTLAQLISGPAGEWSLPASLSPASTGTWLRALCPGAAGVPAAVSDPLHVAGALSLTAPATPPTSPPPTPPPPTPPGAIPSPTPPAAPPQSP